MIMGCIRDMCEMLWDEMCVCVGQLQEADSEAKETLTRYVCTCLTSSSSAHTHTHSLTSLSLSLSLSLSAKKNLKLNQIRAPEFEISSRNLGNFKNLNVYNCICASTIFST